MLLVDDNALFREGLARILKKDGRFLVVGQAGDGLEGAEMVPKVKPDLVLMDLRMPVMDGTQATALIGSRFPKVRIGILTALESEHDIRRALEAGAHGYLPKDATPVDFCEGSLQLYTGHGNRLAGTTTAAPPKGHPPGPLHELTAREIEVLAALAGGETNQAIARRLGVSPKTLRNHISNLYHKLQIYDRAQAVIMAVTAGLVDVDGH